MRHPVRVWALGIGGLALLDLWCDRNDCPGDTLSECTRLVLDKLPGGRRVWMPVLWGRLSWWLIPHICKEIANG